MAVSAERRPIVVASPQRSPSQTIGTAVRYIVVTILAIIVFMPFILSFLGTFKSNPEVTAYPPTFLPREWHFENWVNTWSVEISGAGRNVFARWFFNSFWLAIVNMVSTWLRMVTVISVQFAETRKMMALSVVRDRVKP